MRKWLIIPWLALMVGVSSGQVTRYNPTKPMSIDTLAVRDSLTVEGDMDVLGTLKAVSTVLTGPLTATTMVADSINIGSGDFIVAPTQNTVTVAGALGAGTTTVTSLLVSSNDGGAIGAGGTAFSDLFLATGGVINFGNGNALITHSAGAFSFSGANLTTTGTLGAGAITGSGILSIDDVTDTSSGTTGSIHTDGGVGIAKDLFVGDDIVFPTDSMIRLNTSDGTDNGVLRIIGGGGEAGGERNRGSGIGMWGNESGNTGLLQLYAGNVSGGAITLSTGNDVLAMTVDENQNVGIGTSSPAQLFHVAGGSAGTDPSWNAIDKFIIEGSGSVAQQFFFPAAEEAYIQFSNPSSRNRGAITYGGSSNSSRPDAFGFWTAQSASPRMIIDSSGNVGIGATPTYELEIGDGTGDNTVSITSATNDQAKLNFSAGGTIEWVMGNQAGNGDLFVIANTSSDDLGTGTQAFVIDQSNNVGIGGTPDAKLKVTQTDGSLYGMRLDVNAVLSGTDGLFVYSNTNQTGAERALFNIIQDNASSIGELAVFNNDGTGNALYVSQDGVLATGNHGLYVYSNAAQTIASLSHFHQDNASSTQTVLDVTNDGTGLSIRATSVGSDDVSYDAVQAYSAANGAYVSIGQQSTVVTTSAKTIANMTDRGGLIMVTGSDGNIFGDLLFVLPSQTPTVVVSDTGSGSPAARTYTMSGNNLQLQMASGTYNVHAGYMRVSDY
jgi:hypothetical protein